MADGRCCVNFVRVLVIIFNTIFALAGLAMVGVAVWMLVYPDVEKLTSVSADASNSHLLSVAAILLIVVGALLFVISLVGIIGAVMQHRVVLGIFIAFLIVIFLGEIVGGVLAIVFKDSLVGRLDEALSSSLKEYFKPGTCEMSKTGHDWYSVQKELNCCGTDADDRGYGKLNITCLNNEYWPNLLPFSCYRETEAVCRERACTAWPKSCVKATQDRVTYYAPILIGLGLGVAMIQTIGIIFATCLCVNVPRKASGYKRHHHD